MGYACPVCSDPQADAGHLANHLAFTAMLGDDDHESWLDEHATGWGRMGESELADVVADRVERTEFPELFEDTVGGLENGSDDPPEERSGALFDEESDDHGHGHPHEDDWRNGHGHERGGTPAAPKSGDPVDASGQLDRETAEILKEAREMTRQMHDDESDDDE